MTRAACREDTVSFECEGETLLGIVHVPAVLAGIGVVVVVGGPQYRAGSHRQFVLLARALAENGFAVLRFDYRGMGDASGSQRSFEGVSADIGAAIEALRGRVPALDQIFLWGLCDGASAALLYLHETHDERVSGLCLSNPWVRSEASLARTHVKHYYAQRLGQREFWQKLLRGEVAGPALKGLMTNLRAQRRGATVESGQPFQSRMAQAWKSFGKPILLVLSGDDYTAKEFMEYTRNETAWTALLTDSFVDVREMAGADHTFSNTTHGVELGRLTADWLATQASKHAAAGSIECLAEGQP